MSIHPLAPRALAAAMIIALLACGQKHPARPGPVNTKAAGDSSGGSLANMLMTKFPGVIVSRDGSGGYRFEIRGGATSFNNGTEALVIVDEVPLPEGNGGLAMIDPYDIQRIQVLKNPQDTAIYGMRGANGVIKITTKHSH